jgi:hypothetical protein
MDIGFQTCEGKSVNLNSGYEGKFVNELILITAAI